MLHEGHEEATKITKKTIIFNNGRQKFALYLLCFCSVVWQIFVEPCPDQDFLMFGFTELRKTKSGWFFLIKSKIRPFGGQKEQRVIQNNHMFLSTKQDKTNIKDALVPDRVLISPDFLRTFGLPRFTEVTQKYVLKHVTQRSPRKHRVR